MLRRGRYKYIHYVEAPDQLFDLESDPQELSDLAGNPAMIEVCTSLERELRGILDPLEMDRLAKQDQQELIDRHGGRDAILRRGTFVNSPVPGETPIFTARQQD